MEKVLYLSKNLIFLRKSLNLSQTELAEKIGLNRGNIASYENGTAEPKASNLLKIVKIFNIKLEYLLTQDLEELEEGDSEDELENHTISESDDIHIIRTQAIEILQIIKGKILFHQHRLNKVEELSPDLEKTGQELIDVGNLASELAHSNINLCEKLKNMMDKDSK